MKTTTLGLTLSLCSLAGAANAAQPEKPNLIFVFADQWRSTDVGYMGNRQVVTPNIDKLAKHSVVMTNAVSNCPVSGAYRASLLTGTYNLTNGAFYNDKPIARNLSYIGDSYKDAGYNTAYIGKWHVDGHGRTSFIPQERRMGFEYWKVLECTHDYNKSFYYADQPDTLKWEGYDAIAQTKDAIQYLKTHDKNKPFALFLSWGPPHDPYETAPQQFKDIYADRSKIVLRPNVAPTDTKAAQDIYGGYYSHIAALDYCIGELLKSVDNEGLTKNTIFIFTSDHGDMLLSHGQRNKQQPWDESILVPFVLRYPDQFKDQHKFIDTPFGAVDIMPTLLSMCNIAIPKTVEGNDFSKFIKGLAPAPDTVSLTACYVPFHQWNYTRGGREFRGIRTPRYTFTRSLNSVWMLFDNKKDPFQMNNLADLPEYAALQKHLDQLLTNQLAKHNDSFRDGFSYMREWGYSFDNVDKVNGQNPVRVDNR